MAKNDSYYGSHSIRVGIGEKQLKAWQAYKKACKKKRINGKMPTKCETCRYYIYAARKAIYKCSVLGIVNPDKSTCYRWKRKKNK